MRAVAHDGTGGGIECGEIPPVVAIGGDTASARAQIVMCGKVVLRGCEVGIPAEVLVERVLVGNRVHIRGIVGSRASRRIVLPRVARRCADRKSTRLNSSHTVISYAVF